MTTQPNQAAVTLRANFQDANGVLYTDHALQLAAEAAKDRIAKGGTLFGGLEPSSDGKTRINAASHEVTDVRAENGTLVCDIKLLNTPHGRQLAAMLEAGIPMQFAPRMFGSVSAQGVLGSDVRITSFDLTSHGCKLSWLDQFVRRIYAEKDDGEEETLEER